jgi:hypothetical protein
LHATTKKSDDTNNNENSTSIDTVQVTKSVEPQKQVVTALSTFSPSNCRKVDENKFHVKGQAQVWEANIN